jgi:AraC-like DNA-binding protein
MSTTTSLASMIHALCPRDGSHGTEIAGLFLTRYSTTEVPRTSLQQAVFCVVAQGTKSILINEKRVLYDSSKYLLVSLDLPLVGQVEVASRSEPFLGLSLVLDFDELACLIRDTVIPSVRDLPLKADSVIGVMEDDLLDAVVRLCRLLKQPAQIPVLAPLVRREILYRLLISQQGALLRRMVADSGRVHRLSTGLSWLRRNVALPIRMEQLAREMGMSTSAMHSLFRSVTSMSPLQYQKQLRLQEARRIMLSEALDASTASRRVGYESASQFNREYRRFFGAPPMQDVARLRTALV